jgi:hypothetical protein
LGAFYYSILVDNIALLREERMLSDLEYTSAVESSAGPNRGNINQETTFVGCLRIVNRIVKNNMKMLHGPRQD